jgi:hypothetical protein
MGILLARMPAQTNAPLKAHSPPSAICYLMMERRAMAAGARAR